MWAQLRTHLALLTASGLVSMEDCKALELSVHDLWVEMGDDHASVWHAAGAEMMEVYVPDLAHVFSLVRLCASAPVAACRNKAGLCGRG